MINIHSVELALPGWQELAEDSTTRVWGNADGDKLSLTFIPELSFGTDVPRNPSFSQLQDIFTRHAQAVGGDIVDFAVDEGIFTIVRCIVRVADYVQTAYIGRLIYFCDQFAFSFDSNGVELNASIQERMQEQGLQSRANPSSSDTALDGIQKCFSQIRDFVEFSVEAQVAARFGSSET
jgi:hypothetical protein